MAQRKLPELIVILATWLMPHNAERGLLARYPVLQRFGMINLLAIKFWRPYYAGEKPLPAWFR